jgi:cellulose synthase/poly-beta-1,6-N-acetylglucosamine synthase-like glycosyltransferase
MILLIACSALLLPYGLLMWFYRRAWKQVPVFQAQAGLPPQTMVSVIVPARNEAGVIDACIGSLLAQDYPPDLFEVIVVDDQSTDDTSVILSRYTDPRLKVLSVHGSSPGGKKAALAMGIEAAGGSLILTTDADCTHPASWVRTMAAFHAAQSPVFIAAPVLVDHGKSLLGIFQSLDFLSLQGITAASVYRGFHQMSNGANLGFTANAFREVGGYRGIDRLASGDDMLLMQKMAERHPGRTRYCLSPNTIVHTRPAASLADFLGQRIRWASKARAYTDPRMVAVLLLVYLLNLGLLLMGIQALVNAAWLLPFCILVLAKTAVETWFLWPVARFYGSTRLMAWFLPAQPFHILYTVIAGFFGQVKKYNWKGRQWK